MRNLPAVIKKLNKISDLQNIREASIQSEIPPASDRLEDPRKKKKKKDRKGPLIIDLV